MIKFWDRLQLMLYIVGFDLVSTFAPSLGLLGFGLSLVLWIIFWNWLEATFISINYVKDELAKDKKEANDNKNSGSTNT